LLSRIIRVQRRKLGRKIHSAIPAQTTTGVLYAFYALDADGYVWFGSFEKRPDLSLKKINWRRIEHDRHMESQT
jgi:hypothetical protein